jgi:hypothetical protein
MPYSIAICYWGMTRSTRYVYKSHHEKLFSILEKHNIHFDTYIHTWKVDNNIIWCDKLSIPNDYEEYKYLNPTGYKIEEQQEFLDSINFSEYFYADIYKNIGHCNNGEWLPDLVRNHLCALESQKRVTKMVLSSEKSYDYILYIRPDVEIHNYFPIDSLLTIEPLSCYIVDYDHYEGYNDKFAFMHYKDCMRYSHRIDEIKEYRKLHGRIVSEKYTKYIIDKYYKNIHRINFIFSLVRPR